MIMVIWKNLFKNCSNSIESQDASLSHDQKINYMTRKFIILKYKFKKLDKQLLHDNLYQLYHGNLYQLYQSNLYHLYQSNLYQLYHGNRYQLYHVIHVIHVIECFNMNFSVVSLTFNFFLNPISIQIRNENLSI